jgi:hypothetical protein
MRRVFAPFSIRKGKLTERTYKPLLRQTQNHQDFPSELRA